MNQTPPGLSNLAAVTLRPQQQDGLERLGKTSLGPAEWRRRKASEVRDLFALEEIAERMTVLMLDAKTELRAVVRLRAAVPTLPPGASDLVVVHEVDLALFYPEDILRAPLPGHAIVSVLAPVHVHHSNVGPGPVQALCLGANVPRGYPLREAVIASYGALTMQSATLDELDPAGVMNREAATWWQANPHRIPLCSAPFLARLADEGGEGTP
jgi:hypothetical protein